MTIVAIVLIGTGLAFLAVSAVGLLLFPDFYTRAHVVAKSETFGIILVVLGLIAEARLSGGSARLLLLVLFAAVANPSAIHALARAHSLTRECRPEVTGFPHARAGGDRPGGTDDGEAR